MPAARQPTDPTAAHVDEYPLTGGPFRVEPSFRCPFTGATVLRFALHQPAQMWLRIYDQQGHRVTTPLTGQELLPGEHALLLPLDQLPPGHYVYQLSTDNGYGCFSQWQELWVA